MTARFFLLAPLLVAGCHLTHEPGGTRCGAERCDDDELCCPDCEGGGRCIALGLPCPSAPCDGGVGCSDDFDCGASEMCLFPPFTCGGPGTCEENRDVLCFTDCPGVCGCDGERYCNACNALVAGVSVAPPETCMERCGRAGEICSASQYCDLGGGCGATDAIRCVERPRICDEVDAPVCGCDGRTFHNACHAAFVGVTVRSPGACESACPGGECGPQTCRELQRLEPSTPSGVYALSSPDGRFVDVLCDMSTDGGGWTLVASTRGRTPNDQRGEYHRDLVTLSAVSMHEGIWDGLRSVITPRSDVRFTCRAPSATSMAVDLSFYDVGWYRGWTAGDDEASCFSVDDGRGFESPAPARRDNLRSMTLPIGTPWSAGYLEGEDRCESEDDFTVDLSDRGMDGDQRDGTDWGEDDGIQKCGSDELPDGVWHVWVRET